MLRKTCSKMFGPRIGLNAGVCSLNTVLFGGNNMLRRCSTIQGPRSKTASMLLLLSPHLKSRNYSIFGNLGMGSGKAPSYEEFMEAKRQHNKESGQNAAEKLEREKKLRRRKIIAMIGAAITFYLLVSSMAFYYWQLEKLPVPPIGIEDPEMQFQLFGDKSSAFNSQGPSYDDQIEWDEYWMGMGGKRKEMCKQVEGHDVLEIACGTARNLSYYDPSKIQNLTLIDTSITMLQSALVKYKIGSSIRKSYEKEGCKVHFKLINLPPIEATSPQPQKSSSIPHNSQPSTLLPFDDASFDTIVQSFGLCSTPFPRQMLGEMSRVLKDGGKVYLLEHGRTGKELEESWMGGWGRWINSVLDKTSFGHAEKWGCWWNRDIEELCRNIPGLEVVSCKSSNFGTTKYLELVKKGI